MSVSLSAGLPRARRRSGAIPCGQVRSFLRLVLSSRSFEEGCSLVSLEQSLVDLFIVCLIAALTPIVAGLLSRLRVPQVVILIVGGSW